MALESLIPKDPLSFIKRCVKLKKIKWTYHVNMRMKGRFISREDIINSLEQYEIIEELKKRKEQDKEKPKLYKAELKKDNFGLDFEPIEYQKQNVQLALYEIKYF